MIPTTFRKYPNHINGVVRPLCRVVICSQCHRGFEAHSYNTKRCPECRDRITITTYDKQVIVEFEGYCKRIGLNPQTILNKLVNRNGNLLYRLKTGYKLSEVKKDRYIFILRKFSEDLHKGLYEIIFEPFIVILNYRKKIVRRMTPKERTCPRRISSCIGAFYPGDCPRSFSQCEMSRRITNRKPIYFRNVEDMVRELVSIERRNGEKDIPGYTRSDPVVGRRESGGGVSQRSLA